MIYLEEDEVEDIINALRGDPKHLNLIASLDNMRKVSEEKKKEQKELENQEIWIKCFFNGYFYKFIDMNLSVDIRIENPDYPDKSFFKGTTVIFAPLNEQDGDVDLTPLLHALVMKMKENPTSKVKAFATGFSRQMHFNKDLLSVPLPEGILKMFGISPKKERVRITIDDFSIRTKTILQVLNIEYIDELENYTLDDLKNIKSLGSKSISEIRTVMAKHNLFLKDSYKR